MNPFSKVVFSMDCQDTDDALVKKAIRITSALECRLTIVDCIHELSWLTKLTLPNHESVAELVEKDKMQSIDEMVDRFCRAGVDADGVLLHGPTSSRIVEFCQSQKTDLILRVTRGVHSNEPGRLGRTSKQLLRKSSCPVWLMHRNTKPNSSAILACIDTENSSEEDLAFSDNILRTADHVSAQGLGDLSIIHAWKLWNEKMVKHRISAGEWEKWTTDCQESESVRFNQFLSRHDRSVDDPNVFLMNGEPSTAIPEFAQQINADVVVMGTVGRTGFSGLLLGNTAERIFERVDCDVLALKPT